MWTLDNHCIVVQKVCVGCGYAQSLVCERSTPDQFVIGLSALASFTLYEPNSYSETARLARYPLYHLYSYSLHLSIPLPPLAQVLYGLDVIGSSNLASKSQRGQGIALVFRH